MTVQQSRSVDDEHSRRPDIPASMSTNGVVNEVSADSFGDDNINVVVRCRPLNERENRNDEQSIVQFPGDGGVWVDEGEKGLRPFSFNVVFEPEASQSDVMEHSGVQKLVEMAVDGFSCTCFCYGQTGSGKTHTLTGPPHLFHGKTINSDDLDHGLMFRSFVYLFEAIARRRLQSSSSNFMVKASYLEIYNEKVIDLLNPGTKRTNLNIRWDKRSRAFLVDNLFSIDCEELSDLVAVLEEGLKNRALGSHSMNEHSSRSHTILSVHILSEEKAENNVFISKHGKVNFVDLAGSEMTKKTKSEGKTLEEANNINKSLMVLGYCIAQLSAQNRNKNNGHVPYRDSKLTKLLADSLAGNGVTLMIACVSPAASNLAESLNTLRYASRAKRIRTKPIVVMDPREALIVSLKREVSIVQQENNHLRRLLELADNDHNFVPPQDNSIQLMNQMGMDRTQTRPLDGREAWPCSHLLSSSSSRESTLGSARSRETLRRVSSLLFIASPTSARRIDKANLEQLDANTLVDLIKEYMGENAELRRENSELFAIRDVLLRDQELVCRENERMLKKLEDVTSVCCRSPITRPNFSAELLHSSGMRRSEGHVGSAPNLTSYNNDKRLTRLSDRNNAGLLGNVKGSGGGSTLNLNTRDNLPTDISRELQRRKITNSLSNLSEAIGKGSGSHRSQRHKPGNAETRAGKNSERRRSEERKHTHRSNAELGNKKSRNPRQPGRATRRT